LFFFQNISGSADSFISVVGCYIAGYSEAKILVFVLGNSWNNKADCEPAVASSNRIFIVSFSILGWFVA
jgi:hypothetical protein